MYLPSLGFCLLCATILTPSPNQRSWRSWRWPQYMGIAVLVLLSVGNASRTWNRNRDWDTCATLWESSAAAVPTNEYLWWARAACARERGESRKAQEDYYRRSLAINPQYDRAISELGKLLYVDKRYAEAEPVLTTGLALPKERLE
eukprot:SAG22_NODE_11348_length_489_cov_0.982051_1_plen_145_part_10